MCSKGVSLIIIVYLVSTSMKVAAKSDLTKSLCNLRTDELIKYYGYEAEEHTIQTNDGYILTIFRCNAKNSTYSPKKTVIVAHGILLSSDDFCINPPQQALAYVLADAGYDVWIINSRGNVYSRRHTTLNPNNVEFWNFSFYEIGIYDQPKIIDYVLNETNNSKLYYVGYSQGTTSLMILLSEKPEYNDKIHAAALMAPAAYLDHTVLMNLIDSASWLLQPIESTEVFPRTRFLKQYIDAFCEEDLPLCNGLIDLIAGPSENQRNDTMMPSILCHMPSGASMKQLLHYGQLARYGFFGKFKEGEEIPDDFQLSRIKIPLSIYSSTSDALTLAIDVHRLIAKLNNTEVYLQIIDDAKLNHLDFVWGMHSATLIYSKILKFFDKHQ